MSEPLTLTAVVPVLDEAGQLPHLLAALRPQVDEVVVVDGGSRDGSADLARRHGASVLVTDPGRGPQLAAGAAVARGALLWFVHADSRLVEDAGAAIRRAAAEGARWGCMSVSIDSRDPRLALVARAMNLRAHLTGACSGDMGIWATRALYEEVGGFARLAAFEDLVFADRARGIAPCRVLPARIITSARRWERAGTGRTIACMWALRLAYRVGVPPARLARLYRPDHR